LASPSEGRRDWPAPAKGAEQGAEQGAGREQREGQGRWTGVADEARTAIPMRRLAGSLQVPYLGISRIETVT